MRNLMLMLFALAALVAGVLSFEAPFVAQDDDAEVESDEEESEEERDARLATNAYFILRNNCWGCHGEPGKEHYGETTPLDWILDYDKLVKHKVIIKNSAARSRLIRIILTDKMPRAFDENGKPSQRADLAEGELETLIDWIRAGAPEWKDLEQPYEWEQLHAPVPFDEEEIKGDMPVAVSGNSTGALAAWDVRVNDVETATRYARFFQGKWIEQNVELPENEKAVIYKRSVTDEEEDVAYFAGSWSEPLHRSLEVYRWDGSSLTGPIESKSDCTHVSGYSWAWDSGRDRIVIVNPPANWVITDESCELLQTEPSPPKDGNLALGYDPKADATVLRTQTADGAETWLLKGNEWSKHSEDGPLLPTAEVPRAQYEMVWDAKQEQLVLYGAGEDRTETWGWDGESWSLLCEGLPYGIKPGGRIVWDPHGEQVILYGGYNEEDEWVNETWALKPWRKTDDESVEGEDETD